MCRADESGLDSTFHWYGGDTVVRLQSRDNNDSEMEAEERAQETDADILKKDVVQVRKHHLMCH